MGNCEKKQDTSLGQMKRIRLQLGVGIRSSLFEGTLVCGASVSLGYVVLDHLRHVVDAACAGGFEREEHLIVCSSLSA